MIKMLFRFSVLCLTIVMVAPAAENKAKPVDEAEVRAALARYARAIESMSINQTMDCYADTPDVSVFSPRLHDAITGKVAIRKDWAGFFSILKSFRAEPSDVSVTTFGDAAIVHFTKVEEIRLKNGTTVKPFMRTTQVYRRMGGIWLIEHEHNSMPNQN